MMIPFGRGGMLFVPHAGSARSTDGCGAIAPISDLFIVLAIIFYIVMFFDGVAWGAMEDEVKYFDTPGKRIFFTYPLGLFVGRFLAGKIGRRVREVRAKK